MPCARANQPQYGSICIRANETKEPTGSGMVPAMTTSNLPQEVRDAKVHAATPLPSTAMRWVNVKDALPEATPLPAPSFFPVVLVHAPHFPHQHTGQYIYPTRTWKFVGSDENVSKAITHWGYITNPEKVSRPPQEVRVAKVPAAPPLPTAKTSIITRISNIIREWFSLRFCKKCGKSLGSNADNCERCRESEIDRQTFSF